MSRWRDQFLSHPYNKTLQNFVQKLESSTLPENADENATGEYARISKVLIYLQTILKSIDVDLISLQILNEMNNHLSNAYNDFNSTFTPNSNFQQHLASANNHLDSVLNIVSRSFVYYKKPTKADLAAIQSAYSQTFDEHLANYKRDSDKKLEQVKGRVTSLTDRLNEVKNSLDDLTKEVDAVKKTAQSQLKEQQEKFNNWLEGLNKRADDQFVVLSTKAGAILTSLDKLHQDAEDVFGVVQNTVQAGAHMQYANEERKGANRYRRWAILLMLFAAVIVIGPELKLVFSEGVTQSTIWDSMLKRLPISLIIFAPAFYLARESTRHRQNEVDNRRQELILRTIDPYLALLDDPEKRDNLKSVVAQNIFSSASSDGKKNSSGPHVSVPASLFSKWFIKNDDS